MLFWCGVEQRYVPVFEKYFDNLVGNDAVFYDVVGFG